MGFSVLASCFPVTAQKTYYKQKTSQIGSLLSLADPVVARSLFMCLVLGNWRPRRCSPLRAPPARGARPVRSGRAAFLSQGRRDSALEAKDS